MFELFYLSQIAFADFYSLFLFFAYISDIDWARFLTIGNVSYMLPKVDISYKLL